MEYYAAMEHKSPTGNAIQPVTGPANEPQAVVPLRGADLAMGACGWARSFILLKVSFDRAMPDLESLLRDGLHTLLADPKHRLRMQLVAANDPSA